VGKIEVISFSIVGRKITFVTCTGNCKSNYHMISTMAPYNYRQVWKVITTYKCSYHTKYELVPSKGKRLVDYRGWWVSDCCLMRKEQFVSYLMPRTIYIPWDDNIYFVLVQHT
jgi:hypothetical protein